MDLQPNWQTGRAVASSRDTYVWCPYTDGLGTFRMGPVLG